MEIDSSVCSIYSQRIGNEVGWLEQIVQEGIKGFNSRSVINISTLNQQAERSAHKMQIVYLVNLFEAFMHDFITEKDGLNEEQVNTENFWRDYLHKERSAWEIYCKNQSEPINKSNSFMNIRYSLFVIENRYKIKYPSYLTPMVLELGSLRNCLVHYDGELRHQDKGKNEFKDTLSKTLNFLNLNPTADKIIEINKNGYLKKITSDLGDFVDLCGGFIRRPIDHEKEK